MKLVLTRTQTTSKRFFGGNEFRYILRMKLEVPEREAQLLKKYGHEADPLDLPKDLAGLREDGSLWGPSSISFTDLIKGVEFTCKYLHTAFCALPEVVGAEYRKVLGSILARERWGGEETVTVEFSY